MDNRPSSIFETLNRLVFTKDEDSEDSVRPIHYNTSERRVTLPTSPTPFIRSTLDIIRVPCTSVTCFLCVSNDSQVRPWKSTPSPSLCYSFTHTDRSIGYRNTPHPLADSDVRLIYLRVYDIRGSSSKTVPSPSSLWYSLTHAHRSTGYHNIPQPLDDSTTILVYLRVYDSRDNSYIPTPSLVSLYYSLTLAHSIHTPTPPTPTILTFTFTQVLWFLVCLTRSRVSDVTTRPVPRLTIISTRASQYMWWD